VTTSPLSTINQPRPFVEAGLRQRDFRKISKNGFGDGFNAYAYSMAWFNDHLYVGTARANLHLLKMAMPFVRIDQWPVEVVHTNYSPEFEHGPARGEIWRYHPPTDVWKRVFQAPLITDAEGVEYSRDLGYRVMAIFQGKSDPKPALYAAAWSRSRSSGPEILRCQDGENFEVMPRLPLKSGLEDVTITAIRALMPFKGRLYTTPTGGSKGRVNGAGSSLIYCTDDPASGNWSVVNEPGFGAAPETLCVYEMAVFGDHLYAGTMGLQGFQIWKTDGEGPLPFRWKKIVDVGAGRGALNQIAIAMHEFNGALYVGSGIQNGGFDWRNNVGPAAAEIIRINADDTWDLIVGNPRGDDKPLSGLTAGFNNHFSGYLWRMDVHDNWLYAGTLDWGVILRFSDLKKKPRRRPRLLDEAGVEGFIKNHAGFDLWRTRDGENWVNVTHTGFGNAFNYGCRTLASTPYGLFVGTANPFGPRTAQRQGTEWDWTYEDNPKAGLEIWLGKKERPPIT